VEWHLQQNGIRSVPGKEATKGPQLSAVTAEPDPSWLVRHSAPENQESGGGISSQLSGCYSHFRGLFILDKAHTLKLDQNVVVASSRQNEAAGQKSVILILLRSLRLLSDLGSACQRTTECQDGVGSQVGLGQEFDGGVVISNQVPAMQGVLASGVGNKGGDRHLAVDAGGDRVRVRG